jgi:FkbH-like protein
VLGGIAPDARETAMVSPELHWLPPIPAWNEALRALGETADNQTWSQLVSLANTRITSLGTLQLDRRLTALFQDAPPPGLATKPIRLAVLASSTVDHLLPALRVGALRRGLWLNIYIGHYGQYLQELMDPQSALYQYKPDTVLFALDAHHLVSGFDAGDSATDAQQRLDNLCAMITRQWRLAREQLGCKVIQQTLPRVFDGLFGNNEIRLPGSHARIVDQLNNRLRELADTEHVDLLAIDAQAARDGLHAWYSPVLWHRAKQEIHPAAAPVYGDLFARLIAAQRGRSYKCLVLDLDNTLWGGVIGDDGMEGIVLGQGSALGEAFVAFQHYARSLSRRGIILAVCSKNDEANALEPFDRHPDMVLKRSDIACFVANWTDKATNIREIANRLNIGLDSLVFVDDNPFERQIVRRELPVVAVPELPEDPALYAASLADSGYFEGLHLTAEDLERTHQYQANIQRESLMSSTTDVEGYLRSLNMEAQWSRFDRVGQQRVVQLINKTNQFNLTTKRTDDATIVGLIADARALTLQIRLLDQFGDNGIIAIIIGQFETASTDLRIDTWLMSCRVLGRGVEQTTLNLIAAEAQRLGAHRLIGEYRPTAKNGMVREHYAKLGFAPLTELDGGVTRWELRLDTFAPRETFIRTVQV